MTNDPKFAGGGDEYAPQPVMRQAPQGYQPQPAQNYAPPPAAAPTYAPPPQQAYAPQPEHQAPAPVYARPPEVPAAPAPVATPALEAEGDPNLVVLSKAYKAHDEEVRAVTFRKPTVKDLRAIGYPLRNVIVDGAGQGLDQIPDVCARYMAVLSTPPLPPSTINQFELRDFSACSEVIVSFFL